MFGKLKNKKGASLIEYGIVVGMVSVVGISVINSLGASVSGTFDATQTALSENVASATANSSSGSSGDSGSGFSNTKTFNLMFRDQDNIHDPWDPMMTEWDITPYMYDGYSPMHIAPFGLSTDVTTNWAANGVESGSIFLATQSNADNLCATWANLSGETVASVSYQSATITTSDISADHDVRIFVSDRTSATNTTAVGDLTFHFGAGANIITQVSCNY